MKNRLLPLFVVLGSYSAYSQVGIGTLTPNKSAQLEVVSNDKGILIPQVKLTSTTDTASITSGNVNSLLVFATDVIGDIKPGYYYWYVDKWWRLGSSSDGAACCPTTAIGEGVPGSKGEPGYPGTSIAIYTDSKTGDMYVQNPDGTWTMFSGKNGIDGKNGIAGGNGLPGDKGLDATIEMYIDYNTGVVYVRDPKDKTKWIKVSGKDGINGGNGAPGTNGVSIPSNTNFYIDNSTGTLYVLTPGTDPDVKENWIPVNGKNGIDGKNGIAGGNGVPGASGTAGIDGSIEMYIDYNTGIVYVRDPKDKTKWVQLNGKDGINGGDGAPGTDGVSIPADSNIYIDNSTGTVYILKPGTDPEDPANWIPLNGKTGNNGKDGINGGNGAPGADGVSIPAETTIYIDKSTGTVYILTPGTDPNVPANWIPVNGKNGMDGKNGISGGKGLPGDAGLDATIQMYVDYQTGIVYVRDPEDNTKWVALNGKNGIDGKNGIAGGNGVPGASGTAGVDGSIEMYIDYNTGIVYVRDPKDKTKWVQLNGKDGINGGDGAPGADGVSIPADSNIYIDNSTGTVYILKPGTDPEDPANWIPLNGKTGNNGKDGINGGNGAPGADGVSIPAETTIYIDKSTGTVYILTPGTDPNVPANWIPVNGKNGMDGKNGISGGKGLPGDAGLDATIQMYVDYQTGIVYVRDPEDDTKWVALNGKNGIDGKNGISGGKGLPGDAGLDATIQMYVDYETGIVYVRDPEDNTKWVALNGKNGIDGKNGISGGKGLPGDAGLDATIQMYVDYETGIVYVRDPEDNTKWVALNGKNGIDGKNGIAGGNGVPGASGTAGVDGSIEMYIDYNTGIVYVRDPKDKTKWVQLNGKDGINGGDGAPGADGVSIPADSNIYIDNSTGTVYILKPGTDPEDPANWIPLNGKTGNNGKDGINGGNGAPGADGVSIPAETTIYIDKSTGTVYILTPGTDPNVPANWIPVNGKNGMDGKNGISGGKGLPGDAGLDATIQMYVDYQTGIVYVRDPEDNTKWVALNGKNGIDGKNGIAGGNGVPGASGTAGIDGSIEMYIDYDTGIVYVRDPKNKENWIKLGANETLTTLTNNGSGSYTYKNEAGTEVTIDILNDVANNFQTIVNKPGVTTIIENIVKKTGGNVSYDAITKKFSYIDASGNSQVIDISDLVKASETLTSLTYDATTKKLTYKDEKANPNQIDLSSVAVVPQQVIQEFPANGGETSFTLTDTPSTLSSVKLYINGVRISKNAITLTGTLLNYNDANNGSYIIKANDNIMIDYLK